MRLKDKRAIVTGAGSGFGAGIARKFAAEGALVLLADINHEAAEAQAREIGGRAAHVDVSDGGSMARMVAEARAAMGGAMNPGRCATMSLSRVVAAATQVAVTRLSAERAFCPISTRS